VYVLQAGVKNGMLFGRAKQLCPDLIPIPYDFEGYQRVSRILYNTVAGFVSMCWTVTFLFLVAVHLSRDESTKSRASHDIACT
jgi:hypothetical protein